MLAGLLGDSARCGAAMWGTGLRRTRLVFAISVLLGASGLSSAAAASDESGTAMGTAMGGAATVEACVMVHQPSIDFGTVDFGSSASAPAYAVCSCSSQDQSIHAHATGASYAAGTVGWQSIAGPSTGRDTYAGDAKLGGATAVWLELTPQQVDALAPGGAAQAVHTLAAPPVGSAGAGGSLSFALFWTGVLEAHEPAWTAQPSSTTASLSGVAFVDANRGSGWVIGDRGTVLATVDGGLTWTGQQSGTTPALRDVALVDAGHGWAVGYWGTILGYR
jgi:hypothetical protein